MSKIDKGPAFQDPPARCCLVTLENHVSRENDVFVARDQGEITKGSESKVLLIGMSVSQDQSQTRWQEESVTINVVSFSTKIEAPLPITPPLELISFKSSRSVHL